MSDLISRLELIDRKVLKAAISNSPLIDFTDDDIFELIDSIPTSLSIRQGEWIRDVEHYNVICSVCKYKSIIWNANFCPNCGADMMKGDNNG